MLVHDRWTVVAAAGLACVLLTVPAWADEHASQRRGFDSKSVFQLGDVDHINTFNGVLTLTIPIGSEYPGGGAFSYGLSLVYSSAVWDLTDAGGVTVAWPNVHSNAGLGWRLSPGELVVPGDPAWACGDPSAVGEYCYIAPDGSEHRFLDTLYPGQPDDGWARYTRDGSFLRLRQNGSTYLLDFPNGDTHFFWSNGNIYAMQDRFGNLLTITGVGTNTWTLEDDFGRTHTVNLVPRTYGNQTVPMVSSVVLKTFGNTTATYTFQYTDVVLTKPDQHFDPPEITVPLLTKVTLPDGSSYAMPADPDYHGNIDSPARLRGVIKGIQLPTLGRIEWVYSGYGFPVQTDCGSPGGSIWRRFSLGIYKRTLKLADGSVHGEWYYRPSLQAPPNICIDPPPVEVQRKVVTPLGDKTVYFFDVTLQDFDEGPNYGLPRTPLVSSPQNGNRKLSSQVYDCDPNPADPPNPLNCVLTRTTYLEHQRFAGECAQGCIAPVKSQQTTYADDSDHFAGVTSSDFDGLGHYRNEVTGGDFPAGNVRTVVTNYNPGRGTYPDSFIMPTPAEPWVLNTYTQQTVTQGTQSFRTLSCFEEANGFLAWVRTFRQGTSQGAQDVLVRYGRDAAGNRTSEEYFGGDPGGLPTTTPSSTCGLSDLPANQFRMTHTYASGSLATSVWRQPGGAEMSFKVLDLTIDPSTGLASASRDTAGVQTTYEFDNLGRLTLDDTAVDAQTTYTYTRALSASEPASVRVKRIADGGTTVRTEQLFEYDGLGRLFREKRLMPSGDWSRRRTTYLATGWRDSVSQWTPDGTSNPPSTFFQNYDPFGRPRRIRPPEGAAHDVTLAYDGVRVVERTVKVATGASGGETDSTTTERYDRQGRLWQVTEPSGVGGNNVTTTYSYDAAGRLTLVSTPGAGIVQEREFVYDGRGFLLEERHPEKGPSGNGSVTYADYSARGQVGTQVDGPFTLKYTYDRAGRVLAIRKQDDGLLKQYTYGTGTTAGDRSNGKVETAERWNAVQFDGEATTIRVKEIYTYGGRAGRVSKRQTEILKDGVWQAGFDQEWVYNDLGLVSQLVYPNRLCTGCSGDFPRTVSFEYTQGRLTKIPSLANQITYHPNGLVHEVEHVDGVTWIQQNDPYKHVRPASIATTGVVNGENWTSGTYTYDGAGNVKAIGASRFVYDEVSRVVSGTVSRSRTGSGDLTTQSYTFDAFGNITKITTDGVIRNSSTSASTNRLTGATSYDGAGNVIAWNGVLFAYGPFGELWRRKTGAAENVMLYTADDHRIWQRPGGSLSVYALRDLDGRLLRQYVENSNTGTWTLTDDVWRDGQLVAQLGESSTRRLHVDHLGSTRLITDGNGNRLGFNAYYPFGETATSVEDTRIPRFTGHERNNNGAADGSADTDYMLARHHNPLTGRFLSVDPVGGSPRLPQSWNRYAYAMGNPLKYTDPYGLYPGLFFWTLAHSCHTTDCITVTSTPLATASSPNLSAFADFLTYGRAYVFGNLGAGGPSEGRDFGLFDVARARAFYQARSDASTSVWGIFFYDTMQDILPETQGDLGLELGLAVVPGGKAAKGLTKSFKYALKELGLDAKKASRALHEAKRLAGRGGRDDVLFDTRTGDIVAPESNDVIGNLHDYD